MNKLLLFLCLLTAHISWGQVIDQQIIANSGGTYSQSQVSLDFTIGESIISTSIKPAVHLTQGFHQTNLPLVNIQTVPFNSSLQVYPNPTQGHIHLSSDNDLLQLTLYNSSGKVIREMIKPKDQLDMSNLAKGIYHLAVLDAKGQNYSVKIIKI